MITLGLDAIFDVKHNRYMSSGRAQSCYIDTKNSRENRQREPGEIDLAI